MVLCEGCGGSSGSDDPNIPSHNSSVNGSITGRLFMGGDMVGPWILDFTTGHYSTIPGVNWEDNQNYHHSAEFSAYPTHDGQEFLETIEDCEYLGNFEYRDCLVIHDVHGDIKQTFFVPSQTYGPARLSRDGMFIAVPIRDNQSGVYEPTKLVLYTRDGSYLDTSVHEVESLNFDWLPDNRLLYASDKSLYVTDVASAQGYLWHTFDENEGEPGQLAVSPDGSRLAFVLETYENTTAIFGSVYVINFDGGRYAQLASVPGANDQNQSTTDDPIINHPTWSPDGNWIAVIEGNVAIDDPTPGVRSPGSTLYVVPSDKENVLLTIDGSSDAIPIYSYFDETLTGPENAELSARFTSRASGGFAWLD
jgi:WD40 repeat protein